MTTTTKTQDPNDKTVHFDRQELSRIAQNTGENVRNFISEKTQQADELRVKGEDAVKAHPYKAIAAATLGGILLGAFLRRK